MSKRSLERAFGESGLHKISKAIAEVETRTSAELAVFVRQRTRVFGFGSDRTAVHRKAERLFVKHGLDRTAERSGIMLLVSLRERVAVVLGDIAINAKLGPERWQAVIATLTASAHNGQLVEGICLAVEATGAALATHFPPHQDDRNEIDDKPNLG